MKYKFLAADGECYESRAEALKHGDTVSVIPDFPDDYDPVVKYGPEIVNDPTYKSFFDNMIKKDKKEE